MDINSNSIGDLVVHQLKSYWIDINERDIRESVPDALHLIDEGFKNIKSPRFQVNGRSFFDPLMSIHWMIFLYRLSNVLYKTDKERSSADQVYYLNKILHAIDWFYAVDLPIHFLCEHPIGSVLGRASYGDYFLIYQGTTVGGSIKNDVVYYPVFDDNVILFANSSVLGKSHVGSNVIISAGTKIVNQIIPPNTLVFGESPNLVVKQKDERTMKMKIEQYWR